MMLLSVRKPIIYAVSALLLIQAASGARSDRRRLGWSWLDRAKNHLGFGSKNKDHHLIAEANGIMREANKQMNSHRWWQRAQAEKVYRTNNAAIEKKYRDKYAAQRAKVKQLTDDLNNRQANRMASNSLDRLQNSYQKMRARKKASQSRPSFLSMENPLGMPEVPKTPVRPGKRFAPSKNQYRLQGRAKRQAKTAVQKFRSRKNSIMKKLKTLRAKSKDKINALWEVLQECTNRKNRARMYKAVEKHKEAFKIHDDALQKEASEAFSLMKKAEAIANMDTVDIPTCDTLYRDALNFEHNSKERVDKMVEASEHFLEATGEGHACNQLLGTTIESIENDSELLQELKQITEEDLDKERMRKEQMRRNALKTKPSRPAAPQSSKAVVPKPSPFVMPVTQSKPFHGYRKFEASSGFSYTPLTSVPEPEFYDFGKVHGSA